MRLFYNTNGFAHHRLEDVVTVLAELGYDGVSLTPDVHHLDPYRSTTAEIDRFRDQLERAGLALTIEAGARFVLDPRRKHHPSLMSVDYGRRQEFYRRLVELAALLGSPLVSLWSGVQEEPDAPRELLMARLADRIKPVLEFAHSRAVVVALEPEPGMFVETVAQYRTLEAMLPDQKLALTIDLGHLAAVERPPFVEIIESSGDKLANVHADDAPFGRHEHRMFGEGELDFAALLGALADGGFDGPLSVELSRHSHVAPAAAAQAAEFLRPLIAGAKRRD